MLEIRGASGLSSRARAMDLGDVVGLIRAHSLGNSFATKLDRAVRKEFKAFGRGTWDPLHPDNRRVLVFIRRYKDETILCVSNLSRFAQFVELDLREFKGMVPLELWSKNCFPPIGELPYLLTMGPHNFLWFRLLPPEQAKQYSRS